jgi:hypothetical protein
MGKNLFIFNSKVLGILKASRAFFVAVALLLITGAILIKTSEFAGDQCLDIIKSKRSLVRHKNIFKEAQGRRLVFFIGNSKVLTGLDPELFDTGSGCGTYSYNLALPALQLAPHYFMLKEYLENNPPPEFIIMTFWPGVRKGGLFDTYAIQGAGVFEVLWYSFLKKDTRILANYFLPWKLYSSSAKKYVREQIIRMILSGKRWEIYKKNYGRSLSDKETYPHDWDYYYTSKFVHPVRFAKMREVLLAKQRGRYGLAEQAAQGGRLPDDYVFRKKGVSDGESDGELAETDDPFIDLFFTLALKNNIKVIMVADYMIAGERQQMQSLPDAWKRLKEKYSNVYFADNGYKMKFYEPKCFSDPAHLNNEGMQLYTREIAEEFKRVVNKIKASNN